MYSTLTSPQRDQVQMQNLLDKQHKDKGNRKYFGRSEKQLVHRLDTLLLVLKSCKRDSCRAPWNAIFPGGKVNNLKDAMSPKLDKFFENQPRVKFAHCIGGHIPSLEGPQNAHVFKSGK